MAVDLKDGTKLQLDGKALDEALQYSPSYGIPRLVAQLKSMQQQLHRPRSYASADEWAVMVCNGSQDGEEKAFQMILDDGDGVICESPTYSGTIAALRPLRCNIVDVPCDKDGMDTEKLEKTLLTWPRGQPKPKLLYTIPTGQNQSGSTLSLDRRRHMLRLADEHDFLIMEDDPYYHLQFLEHGEERLPTLFELDTSARVLRFDSLSKVVSSGLRVGWATGPRFLVEKLQLHEHAANLCISGLSQLVVSRLLEHWGMDGFLTQRDLVEREYRRRRDLFCSLARRELSGLAHFDEPRAGMFLWMQLPNVASSESLINQHAMEERGLLVPGTSFDPQGKPSNYVRASFSTASDAEMEEGLQRLKRAL